MLRSKLSKPMFNFLIASKLQSRYSIDGVAVFSIRESSPTWVTWLPKFEPHFSWSRRCEYNGQGLGVGHSAKGVLSPRLDLVGPDFYRSSTRKSGPSVHRRRSTLTTSGSADALKKIDPPSNLWAISVPSATLRLCRTSLICLSLSPSPLSLRCSGRRRQYRR